MKVALTPNESKWLNDKMRQLQTIAVSNPDTQNLAHMTNKIRYNTDGHPPIVFLTREQRILVLEIATHRFKSLDLVPCDERDVVASLITKVRK